MADENPYAPPAAPVEAQAAPAPAPAGVLRPMSGLARTIGAVMLGLALLDAMSLVNSVVAVRAMHRVLNDEPWEQSELVAIDARARVAQVTHGGLYLTGAVMFCVFMVRGNRNARALGATLLRYSPGWAAGSFFVPVWCLYGPYEAMKEIWRHSDPDPGSAAGLRTPSVLAWWWGLYLASNLVSQVAKSVTKGGQGPAGVIAANYGAIVAAMVLVPAALTAAAAVRAVARRQDQAASARTTFVPATRS